MPTVSFYFDVVCPYAYLASTQLAALEAQTGARIDYAPVLLGGVFRSIGAGDGPMSTMSAAKARLTALDMWRWAAHLGVPFQPPAGHPRRTVLAMRAVIASGDVPRAAHALFAAYWAEGRDVADEAVVRAALDAAGLPGAEIVAAAASPALKSELRARTDAAVAAGVFGVPTFVVGDELWWGQDRISFVRDHLTRTLEAPA